MAYNLYWEFHSAFTKIKSYKSEDFSPNVFFLEEKEYDDITCPLTVWKPLGFLYGESI